MLERLAKAGRKYHLQNSVSARRRRRSTFDSSMAMQAVDEWRPVGCARAWAREGEREGGTLNQRAQREGDRGVGESVARERRVRRSVGTEYERYECDARRRNWDATRGRRRVTRRNTRWGGRNGLRHSQRSGARAGEPDGRTSHRGMRADRDRTRPDAPWFAASARSTALGR